VAAKPGQRRRALPMQENADRANFGTLAGQFQGLRNIIAKRKEVVGPAAGRLGTLQAEWIGGDPDAADAYQKMDDIANQLIYLASGKQINEEEFKRLKKTFPHKNLPYDTFMVRLNNFQDRMASIYRLRTGKELPKGPLPSSQSSTPPPQQTQGKPVLVNGKVVGYTTDGKTMTPVGGAQ
jgi:hypothetical protein